MCDILTIEKVFLYQNKTEVLMKKKKHLFTVLLLAISLLLTSIPVYAQGNGNTDNENSTNEESFEEADRNLMKDLLPGDLNLVELSDKELEDYEIPEVISAKDIKEKEHANRLFAQETDDYSIVYQNKDGSKTMYYFDEPVKYTDENGTVCDKSTKLSESDKDGYAFVSADNDINVYMPEQLDKETGIIVKSGGYTIEMSPVDSDKANVSDIITETENKYDEHDIVEYTDVFGVDTTIEYSAQLNGVKENIILDRYNGKNEFSFDVDTNGLVLREEEGYFSIVDDEINEVVGTVSEVILFDSSNGENTIVPQGYVTGYTAVQNDDGRYTITITLDNEWLENEAVYPVVIDPTIKINTSGSGSSKTILDAPVYSKKSTTNFGSYSIGTVGYQDSTYGAGRLIMRFPGLDSNATYKSLKASEIESVKLYMYEGTGNSGTSTLQVRFSLNDSGWSESSPIYANTNVSSKVMSTTTIKKSGVCSFDFTELAIASKYAGYDIKKGIVITNTNETNASLRRSFYMTEYSSSKPKVVVEWNPVIDGMAYVFKTNDIMSSCLTNTGNIIKESALSENAGIYYSSNQIWVVKKSPAGEYILYSVWETDGSEKSDINKAICVDNNDNVTVSNCTSDTNPYFRWDIVKVNKNEIALKNVYSGKWLYKNDNDNFALTADSTKRELFKLISSNYPYSFEGSYAGQTGTYQVNIIFSLQSDYDKFASSVESWNGICDKITVKACPPNSNYNNGLNVKVVYDGLYKAGIETEQEKTIYAVYVPNADTGNYATKYKNIKNLLKSDWSSGVIVLNNERGRFTNLSLENQKACIIHEVGHALKLCHSDKPIDDQSGLPQKYQLVPKSIMRELNSKISNYITLYDKSSLIKKWRNMP